MTNRLAAALQGVGIAATATGVGLYSIPAGVIVAGIGALAVGVALERGTTDPDRTVNDAR
jgi:hypothetical protein